MPSRYHLASDYFVCHSNQFGTVIPKSAASHEQGKKSLQLLMFYHFRITKKLEVIMVKEASIQSVLVTVEYMVLFSTQFS